MAVLERRPKLALVDELAHANLPGERHAKRWQDIDEVLESGIDVFTTLNATTSNRWASSCLTSPARTRPLPVPVFIRWRKDTNVENHNL